MRLTVHRAIEGTRVRVSRKADQNFGRLGTIAETPPERRGYYGKTQYIAVRVQVKLDGDEETTQFVISALSLAGAETITVAPAERSPSDPIAAYYLCQPVDSGELPPPSGVWVGTRKARR